MSIQIVILCILSITISLLGLGYLSHYELKDENPEATFTMKSLVEKKSRMIYAIVMLFCLCGMSVVLAMIYPGNELLENLKRIILLAILFVVAFIDYKKFIIPNQVIVFALLVRFGFYIAEFFIDTEQFWVTLKNHLLALGIVVVFFIVGVLIVKNGLGMGDVKLMIVMCLYQGFSGVISSLFFSLCVAFVLSIGLLISKKKTKKDSIAFAPSILCGTVISVFMTGM